MQSTLLQFYKLKCSFNILKYFKILRVLISVFTKSFIQNFLFTVLMLHHALMHLCLNASRPHFPLKFSTESSLLDQIQYPTTSNFRTPPFTLFKSYSLSLAFQHFNLNSNQVCPVHILKNFNLFSSLAFNVSTTNIL